MQSTEQILLDNALPVWDQSNNATKCCPRFDADPWHERQLRFRDKLFVRAETSSLLHIPVNMGAVFERTFKALEDVGAMAPDNMIVLSRDLSSWKAEHLFSTTGCVPGQMMVRLTGDFQTRVFEGPYRHAAQWHKDLVSGAKKAANPSPLVYLFYTTCPKCAKVYGQNYVVGFVETSGHPVIEHVGVSDPKTV